VVQFHRHLGAQKRSEAKRSDAMRCDAMRLWEGHALDGLQGRQVAFPEAAWFADILRAN